MQQLLEKIHQKVKPYTKYGKTASYIPALAKINKNLFGIYIYMNNGENYGAGDYNVFFTMQSISKIFSLAYVLNKYGEEKVFKYVDREPSGDPFYSLVLLEYENGRPRNPLINAGAIFVTSLITGKNSKDKFLNYLNFLKKISYNSKLKLDKEVYDSEYQTGYRNRALGNLMKHFEILHGSVDSAVDAYFMQCSVRVTCKELARMSLFLSNHGTDPITNKKIISKKNCKTINALMATCGLYDASGEFAYRVGLPGKSGVSGGILAIVPDKMSIVVFSPSLDEKGNSVAGFKALELLSNVLKLSLYL
jgi:glutaminase